MCNRGDAGCSRLFYTRADRPFARPSHTRKNAKAADPMTDNDPFTNLYAGPMQLSRAMFAPMAEMAKTGAMGAVAVKPEDAQHWAEVGTKLQAMWMEFASEQAKSPPAALPYLDPSRWMALAESWYSQMPVADPQRHMTSRSRKADRRRSPVCLRIWSAAARP